MLETIHRSVLTVLGEVPMVGLLSSVYTCPPFPANILLVFALSPPPSLMFLLMVLLSTTPPRIALNFFLDGFRPFQRLLPMALILHVRKSL